MKPKEDVSKKLKKNQDIKKERFISDQIVSFLISHPFLSKNAIEAFLKIPQATLYKALNKGLKIPSHHQWELIKILSDYGLVLDGFAIHRQKNDPDKIVRVKFSENFEPQWREEISSYSEL